MSNSIKDPVPVSAASAAVLRRSQHCENSPIFSLVVASYGAEPVPSRADIVAKALFMPVVNFEGGGGGGK